MDSLAKCAIMPLWVGNLEPMEPFMQRSVPSKFGVISVISTAIVLILIMGLAIFSFLTAPEEPLPVKRFDNPISAIAAEQVDPALAIALLAGISETDVIDQAINKSRPGTALATIISSPGLNAKDAAGALLLLGGKFSEQDDIPRAILSYQLAGTLATLSPDLSDTLRADIFLQAGIGLTKLEEPILAKVYLDQAVLVATESTYLQPAYRYSVLEALHKAYLDLDLKEEAIQSLQLSLEPADLSDLPEKPLVLPAVQEIALPTHVQDAEAQRWRAAQFVAKDLVELGGVVRPELLEALRVALLKEDEVKSQYFAESAQAEAQLSGKVNIVQEKIGWQSIKYRVARQGFGVSLVPEWEAAAEQIQADLAASYQELYRFYDDIIVAIPLASDIDRAKEEALRRQVLAGQLGHYPDYPGEELKLRLLQASATLIETQPNTELRVSYLSVDDADYYTLISDQDVLNQ